MPDGYNYWEGSQVSSGAAIVFAVLFGISAFFHIYQLFKYRAWYFSAFTLGGLSKFPIPPTVSHLGLIFDSDGGRIHLAILLDP